MIRIAAAFLLLVSLSFAAGPIIFDTDIGNDIDDALALAMLHALTDRAECRLIGVMLTNGHPMAVPYIRKLDLAYGRRDLPVGKAIRRIKGGDGDNYLSAALGGAFHSPSVPSAPDLLRQLLRDSAEKVTIVQTGFSTNLAALLDAPDGPALIRSKVALLVVMAGNFAGGEPEYNVRLDIPAAKTVFERWPTPIVFSGFEIGKDLLYPAASIERDFSWGGANIIAASYRAYHKMPYDRPTWDLTAVLQAVRPDRGYFGLSEPGTVHVDDRGATHFTPGNGDRRYLKLDPANRAVIIATLTLLASQPPAR